MMTEYVRVKRVLLEQCFNIITEKAIKDYKPGFHKEHALARDVLHRLIRLLDSE
jgi:hypothetical protein